MPGSTGNLLKYAWVFQFFEIYVFPLCYDAFIQHHCMTRSLIAQNVNVNKKQGTLFMLYVYLFIILILQLFLYTLTEA